MALVGGMLTFNCKPVYFFLLFGYQLTFSPIKYCGSSYEIDSIQLLCKGAKVGAVERTNIPARTAMPSSQDGRQPPLVNQLQQLGRRATEVFAGRLAHFT